MNTNSAPLKTPLKDKERERREQLEKWRQCRSQIRQTLERKNMRPSLPAQTPKRAFSDKKVRSFTPAARVPENVSDLDLCYRILTKLHEVPHLNRRLTSFYTPENLRRKFLMHMKTLKLEPALDVVHQTPEQLFALQNFKFWVIWFWYRANWPSSDALEELTSTALHKISEMEFTKSEQMECKQQFQIVLSKICGNKGISNLLGCGKWKK